MAMYERRPPREITEIINFPIEKEVKFNRTKFYNNAVERADKLRLKYKKSQPKVIKYEVGDRVPVSYTHLDVYKRQSHLLRKTGTQTVTCL